MKKIGIVILKYWLGTSLSLTSSAVALAREGYDVHIFIDRSSYEFSKADFEEDNISLHLIEVQAVKGANDATNAAVSNRWKATIVNLATKSRDKWPHSSVLLDTGRLILRNLRALESKWNELVASFRYFLHARAISTASTNTIENYAQRFFPFTVEFYREITNHIDEDYVCFIGVEPFGLIAATLVASASKKKQKIPVIYYNHELLLESECHDFKSKIKKALERTCNQTCYFTIIQDRRRAEYLRDDNKLEEGSIVCVPVSSLAQVDRRKGGLLQDTYNIPREKKILLHPSTFATWWPMPDLAQKAQKWRDDFVLVLHSSHESSKNEPWIKQIKEMTETKKVYLSLKQLEWQKMSELISSADIGLIFYPNLGPNFYETGHSSNKLVSFLQVGLPVITTDFPSLRRRC